MYRFIGGFRPGSRRSSDLGGEELGDFCNPRPEEWERNVEANQTEDARINRIREWNGYVRSIPAACKHEEEMEIGAKLHRV